ncbi:MAG: hypothetical protein K6F98_09410 [Bacteroidales bacterium]|nr:hypothetical protein [Bacteroidales bacterium]
MRYFFIFLSTCLLAGCAGRPAADGQTSQTQSKSEIQPNWPASDIKYHDFLYAGEWDTRKPDAQSMFLVRDGRVVWQYSTPLRDADNRIHEFDDATLLPDGNIVFACMTTAGIVSPDKQLLWEFHCPEGTETHSCVPVGRDSVLMALNGTPAKVLMINTRTNEVLREVVIPTSGTNSHGQFRRVRLTPEGNIMVPLKPEGKVSEFTWEGEEVWSVPAKSAWAAIRLSNGNTLISGDGEGYTREVNKAGETVWELTQQDVPFKLYNTQTACRLENGNTVICNWCAGQDTTLWKGTVQIFEVTPAKQVVWALSEWDNPDLGPATSVEILK